MCLYLWLEGFLFHESLDEVIVSQNPAWWRCTALNKITHAFFLKNSLWTVPLSNVGKRIHWSPAVYCGKSKTNPHVYRHVYSSCLNWDVIANCESCEMQYFQWISMLLTLSVCFPGADGPKGRLPGLSRAWARRVSSLPSTLPEPTVQPQGNTERRWIERLHILNMMAIICCRCNWDLGSSDMCPESEFHE